MMETTLQYKAQQMSNIGGQLNIRLSGQKIGMAAGWVAELGEKPGNDRVWLYFPDSPTKLKFREVNQLAKASGSPGKAIQKLWDLLMTAEVVVYGILNQPDLCSVWKYDEKTFQFAWPGEEKFEEIKEAIKQHNEAKKGSLYDNGDVDVVPKPDRCECPCPEQSGWYCSKPKGHKSIHAAHMGHNLAATASHEWK